MEDLGFNPLVVRKFGCAAIIKSRVSVSNLGINPRYQQKGSSLHWKYLEINNPIPHLPPLQGISIGSDSGREILILVAYAYTFNSIHHLVYKKHFDLQIVRINSSLLSRTEFHTHLVLNKQLFCFAK